MEKKHFKTRENAIKYLTENGFELVYQERRNLASYFVRRKDGCIDKSYKLICVAPAKMPFVIIKV